MENNYNSIIDILSKSKSDQSFEDYYIYDTSLNKYKYCSIAVIQQFMDRNKDEELNFKILKSLQVMLRDRFFNRASSLLNFPREVLKEMGLSQKSRTEELITFLEIKLKFSFTEIADFLTNLKIIKKN